MKYTSIILTLFIVHCTLFIAKAQVAINTDNTNPDSSAILDIKSTNKGFLYPRMTTTERDAISNPSIGLTIFNLDDKCTDIYDGNAWMKDCPLVLIPDSTSNGIWTQKANFGGDQREWAVGFSINDKGYIGTGDCIGAEDDLWEYDPSTNIWTERASIPNGWLTSAVGFSINGKGYIGTGSSSSGLQKDFWEYDPSTNTWTQKADFPGTARRDAVGFSINSKGYIGTGNDSSLKKDFWEYDPITNTWTQKADFPGTAREEAVGFSINDKGYIGTGLDASGRTKDFWEYNPSTNTWTQKADFSGTARWESVGFSIDDKGYIGTGLDASGRTKDFWEYDPSINTWTQKTDFSGTARSQAVGFSINDKGYIGTGSFCTADFREVEIPSPTTSYQTSNPLIGTILNSTINDIDNDTKIQVEGSNDEDIIRFDVEGRESVNMDNDFPINVIATPSNRHLLRLFTTADTAAWHLRLQGISNKDLGFTETSVADNRFVLAAGGNVGIGTANPNTALEVNGTVTATSFSGDGSNLTNVPDDNLGNHTATTTLNLANNNITNAGSVTATSFIGDGSSLSNVPGDNLGDHTATQNIQLNNQWLSGDGGNEGLQIDNIGNVGINISPNSAFPLTLKANNSDSFFRFQHSDNTDGWHIREQGVGKQDLGFSESGVADNRLVLEAGGNIGIGIADPNVALDVNGSIEYTGTITDVSDSRLKENFLPISAVLTKLLQLQAYSYNMVDDAAKTREYGLLAQEVQKVFPELVSNIDAEGEYLGLSYIQLIPILIEGVKELKMENEALKTENKLLQLRDKSVEARLSQIEVLLSQKETVETNTIHSEK